MEREDIQKIIARLQQECEDAAAEAEEGVSGLATQLAELDVSSVYIEFSGSGDSGDIDYVSFEPSIDTKAHKDLVTEIYNWAEKVLEGTGVDWYNNEGGYGTINLDVENRHYSFEVYQNHMDSTLEASDTISI